MDRPIKSSRSSYRAVVEEVEVMEVGAVAEAAVDMVVVAADGNLEEEVDGVLVAADGAVEVEVI